jgi:hypothetical protein
VDEDAGCQSRIEESRDRIEKELGIRIVVLDAQTKSQISTLQPRRPDDWYRDGMKEKFPIMLMYTRYVGRSLWYRA